MLVVADEVVLGTEALELLVRRFLERFVQLVLHVFEVQFMRDLQVIVDIDVVLQGKLEGLIQEVLHLLLQIGVQLSLELFLLLFGRKAFVVHLFVVLLDSKAEDSLL